MIIYLITQLLFAIGLIKVRKKVNSLTAGIFNLLIFIFAIVGLVLLALMIGEVMSMGLLGLLAPRIYEHFDPAAGTAPASTTITTAGPATAATASVCPQETLDLDVSTFYQYSARATSTATSSTLTIFPITAVGDYRSGDVNVIRYQC